jgi:hypothetical protein
MAKKSTKKTGKKKKYGKKAPAKRVRKMGAPGPKK